MTYVNGGFFFVLYLPFPGYHLGHRYRARQSLALLLVNSKVCTY